MADRTTEMEAALRAVIRVAEAAKEPVFGMDPESPAAIRNGVFANIAQVAAQGLGWMSGPALDTHGVQANGLLLERLRSSPVVMGWARVRLEDLIAVLDALAAYGVAAARAPEAGAPAATGEEA